MIKQSVTPGEVVSFLNQLIPLDPAAIDNLFMYRTLCTQALADHPSVQVRQVGEVADGVPPTHWIVGLLGIINGMFGTADDGWGAIAGHLNDQGKLIGFNLTEQARAYGCREMPWTYAVKGDEQLRQKLYERVCSWFEAADTMQSSTARWMLVDHLMEVIR